MARTKSPPKKSAATSSAAPSQIVVAPDQPMGSIELAPAIAVYNGMVAHGWTGRFPADLDASTVYTRLIQHLTFERERADRGAKARQLRDTVRQTEETVLDCIGRLSHLVTAYHPRGSKGRAAFFPTGKGAHTLARRLTAMIQGIESSGLPDLPADLSVALLKKLLEALPRATEEATAGGIKTGAVSLTRENLDAKTREVRLRLTALAQGILGADSPELADFGLTPRSSKRKRAPSKSAAKTPSDGSVTASGTAVTK